MLDCTFTVNERQAYRRGSTVGFLFTLAYSRISHEYSSLLIIVINLIFFYVFTLLH